MARILLKRYSVSEIEQIRNDANENFSFFAIGGTLVMPITVEQVESTFQSVKEIYGFFNIPAPVSVSVRTKHEDSPGTLKVEFIYNAKISPAPAIINFLALNTAKQEFSDEDISIMISDKLKNKLMVWTLEHVTGIPIDNLKQYQADAFLDDNGKNELQAMLPAWLDAQYKDTNCILLSGDVLSAEDEKLLEQQKRLLTEAKKLELKGQENKLKGHKIVADVEDSRLTDVDKRQKIARNIAEITGITFDEALEIIKGTPDIKTAQIVADEYVKDHQQAIAFKNKFNVDILTAKFEINDCGSAKKAFEIWETAEQVQKKHPKYKLAEFCECVAYVKKIGVKRAEAEASSGQNKKICIMILLAILTIIIVSLVIGGIISAKSAYSTLSIKVLSGTPNAMEKVFYDAFGKDFSYDISSRTFSVNTTKGKKLDFISSLKKAGYELQSTADPNAYAVVISSGSEKLIYKVDATSLANNANAMKKAGDILGITLKGNNADVVSVTDAQLVKLQESFIQNGFSLQFQNDTLVISEKHNYVVMKAEGGTQNDVFSILTATGIKFQKNGFTATLSVTAAQLSYILETLQNSGKFGKIKLSGNSYYMIFPKGVQTYNVRIYLNTEREYAAAKTALQNQKLIKLTQAKFTPKRMGVAFAELEVKTEISDISNLKNLIFNSLSASLAQINERDIKITENN